MLVSFFSPDKPLSAKSRLPTAAVEEACWPTKIPIHVNSNNTRYFSQLLFSSSPNICKVFPLGVKISKTQISLESEKCKTHGYRADLGCKIISSLFYPKYWLSKRDHLSSIFEKLTCFATCFPEFNYLYLLILHHRRLTPSSIQIDLGMIKKSIFF